MLVTIATGLLYVEMKDKIYKIFSDLVKKFWSKWELRVMILLSLILQFVLVRYGNRRKYGGKATPWVAILVWSTYLLADWVATVSLSNLLNSEAELYNPIVLFWTPFLLLHLGGPDSITAYSLEDTELWLRHLLGLVIQVALSLYIYLRFRTNSPLNCIAIFIFIAGIIKYGERIWILRAASNKQFRNSMFSSQNATMESGSSTRIQDMDTYLSCKDIDPEARYLHKAYLSVKMFTPLFADLTLRIYEELQDIFTIRFNSAEEAFKLVETELGFLYDMLYTKRIFIHSKQGAILRSICSLSSVIALVSFTVIIGENGYSKVDICLTYLLLVGAVFLELYSFVLYFLSNWTMLWMTEHKHWPLTAFFYRFLASRSISTSGNEGLRFLAQLNLIDCSLTIKAAKFSAAVKILDTDNILGKYWNIKWKDVSLDTKKLVYSHLLEKRKQYVEKGFDSKFLIELLSERGNHVLKSKECLNDFCWATDEVEFNHSILLWHIATELCYQHDLNRYQDADILGSNHEISKQLSDYMLYLLVVRPFMLPKGISEVRNRDTYMEALRFLPQMKLDSLKAAMALLEIDLDVRLGLAIPGKSKSVLFDGCKLAQQLQSLVTDQLKWDHEEKWEMISLIWVEMLIYAGSHCGWREHVQQLRRGEELLTHVSLLMAHLGLSRQIRVVKLPENLQDMNFKPPWNWDNLYHLAYYLA